MEQNTREKITWGKGKSKKDGSQAKTRRGNFYCGGANVRSFSEGRNWLGERRAREARQERTFR